jgi:hypothetical protein
MAGAVLATIAFLLMVLFIAMEFAGFVGGPYLGILTYLILPMMLLGGLVLMPVGAMIRRRQEARAVREHGAPPRLPVVDLNDPRTRSLVMAGVVVGLVGFVVVGGATWKGVHVMESVAFCGTTCHTVMEPEHTAFLRSPHNKLRCADCHIGEGADWFVKSKVTGSWQLISVAFDLYPRPVPSPVHNLRSARETCEQCHWPTRYVGDKLVVKTKFADDEKNSETKTVMTMKVGGQQGNVSSGIHWHVDRGVRIRYLTDPSRRNIFDVEMKTADGRNLVYKTDKKPEGPSEWREMDCVDCHNRPTHIFRTPSWEVDAAMADGRIDKSLPFVKREGVRVLEEGKYASKEEAKLGIAKAIEAFYREKYAEVSAAKAAQIAAAGKALGEIYSWNVFPKMNVTWGTYANHLGHDENNPGCFRCHDNKHVADGGEKIGKKCKTCHSVLAEDEAEPEILKAMNP